MKVVVFSIEEGIKKIFVLVIEVIPDQVIQLYKHVFLVRRMDLEAYVSWKDDTRPEN